jgi:hypothetical protein
MSNTQDINPVYDGDEGEDNNYIYPHEEQNLYQPSDTLRVFTDMNELDLMLYGRQNANENPKKSGKMPQKTSFFDAYKHNLAALENPLSTHLTRIAGDGVLEETNLNLFENGPLYLEDQDILLQDKPSSSGVIQNYASGGVDASGADMIDYNYLKVSASNPQLGFE